MYKIRGFTLIELMVAIIVVGILIALALPSFRDLIERKRLGGAVEAVFEQLEFARSQAVKRSRPMLVDFYINNVDLSAGSTDWSIGLTDKMAGCDAEEEDVSDADACTIDYDNDGDASDNILVRIHGGDYKDITMSQANDFGNDSLVPLPDCSTTSGEQGCFDYVHGFARQGAYDFTSTNGTYTMQVQVDQLGRMSVCVPSGKNYIAGYEEC